MRPAIRRGIVLIAALCVCLLPVPGRAAGLFWLPTQTASDASFDHLNPVLVAYHNHGYVLSVRVNGSSSVTSVFFSTDESGQWTTQLLTDQGPHNTYSGEFTSLAVDPSNGRLYAIWAYAKSPGLDAIGVWTRDQGGQWSGPTDIAESGSLGGQPSIVAANGKAYAAFESSPQSYPGPCDDGTSRAGDLDVVSFDGTSWSAPQNLTSCVSNSSILEFVNPKLALDESGRAYLVTFVNGDLWYLENGGTSWTDPTQITQGANITESVGTSGRTFFGIAADNGTAYVVYGRSGSGADIDVLLMSHPFGGSWSGAAQVSPQDPQKCPKFGLSIAAGGGRVAVSYIRGHTGYCTGSTGIFGNQPFLFTGAPGSMTAVGSPVQPNPDCFYTSLANEGNLFRFVTSCDHPSAVGAGQLYYAAEFLDTIGPIAHLQAPSRAAAPAIPLRWSARDPQPGSGVAFYQLQVRVDGGPWHTVPAARHVTQLVYRQAQAGRRYTFRLRARDRTANWGAWVTRTTLVK